MKRTYKNLSGLVNNIQNDLTLENIINKRAYFKTGKEKGWQFFNFELDNSDYEQISDLLGGSYKTKNAVIYTLKIGRISHWGLSRIMYSAKRKIWTYCAGQDYPREIAQIRNHLKN